MSEDTTLYGCPRTESRGQVVIHPSRETYLDAVKAATDDGYTMCVDVTAVDYSAHPARFVADGVEPERFEVVVSLLDMGLGGAQKASANPRRLRVRVQVPDSDPTIDSLFDLHPGTEALEREAYDMFGIEFTGHPDLTRILMPEDWEGHPLRKDYAVGEIPVQFKHTGVR